MLKWTVAGQQRAGGTTAATTWRRQPTAPDDGSPVCFTENPTSRARRRRRRSSMSAGSRYDKENSTRADVTPKTCRRRRRESLRDVSNHNSPATLAQMSPGGGRRTKSPCTDTHWMPLQKRRSGDDAFRGADDPAVKRKKPCTGEHAIVVRRDAVADARRRAEPAEQQQLCVTVSPTEEPVQLSHKQLPAARPRLEHPAADDDMRASRLIDRFVDQIRMDDDGTPELGNAGLSIVSPLAKRLADIRLRRSPDASPGAGKRKRAADRWSPDRWSLNVDDNDFLPTPVAGRPAAFQWRWWQQCSGGGGGGGGGLTLPDGLPSPFHSSHRHHHSHRLLLTVPPSPITPLRPAAAAAADSDGSDWKTPVGPSLIAGVRAESLLSTASSKSTAVDDDDVMIRCPDQRSPTALDDTFAAFKSRRCLSFASPPPPLPPPPPPQPSTTTTTTPSARKKSAARRSLKKSAAVTASVDKASGLEVSIGLRDLTHLNVLLKRGRNLVCSDGEPPNTYIKVYLVPGKGTCHRTRVRHNSANPRFDESFSVPLAEEDHDKRILISAWHRHRSKRRSEFLGYMSFAVKNVVKKEINGTFKIVPQSPGRMPPHSTPAHRPQDLTVVKTLHSTDDDDDDDGDGDDENIMIDDEPASNNHSMVSAAKVKSGQKPKKDAPTTKTAGNEENKFLQYLELDPPLSSRDGKSGRTPFTVTKRLSKPSGSSFGFSIAWTHPPRVERVECGLPADQADLKPGDYVVFINKTNVVMMAEDDVMDLIKSCGNQLSLEVYNRTSTRNRGRNQPPPRSASIPGVLSLAAGSAVVSQSDTTVSLQEPPRHRRFHIPQVTFTSENLSGDMGSQLRWIHQLLTAEQQFVLCLQFGISRYLLPLAERKDVLKSKEHSALFQNVQELLRTTEDTLEQIVEDDWKMLARNTCNTYVKKIDRINGAYYKYCKGVVHADSVLVDKMRNPDFLELVGDPPVPDRRPALIAFVHRPPEHYRNLLKCMQLIQNNTERDDEEYEALSHIVHEMQTTYRFITIESGLTEPELDGKPLLSLTDLETRLVFTRCKPFTLNTPDRHWIFAGDLCRVEGRSVRSYWALLFSDILLFTKVSRDRVLFVTDEPLPLSSIVRTQFSVKKKDTEFRLIISSGSDAPSSCHSSPAMTGCNPLLADLSGTLSRLPKNRGRAIVLRAPKPELKAVWQNLIQRQILTALEKNADDKTRSGKAGCPSASSTVPATGAALDSPDDLLTNSLATLDDDAYADRLKTFAESLVDERCQRMTKSSACNKGKALHISQWIKGELGARGGRVADGNEDEDGGGDGSALELWPAERMDAIYAEIQRRLTASAAVAPGRNEHGGGTVDDNAVSTSSADSQRTVVVPADERDLNGNRRSDTDAADVDRNNNDPNGNGDGDGEGDDDDCLSVAPWPPDNRRNRNGCQRQQPALRQPWRSSTPSLDRLRDHSSDSLDRVEFCSTTDYRWPEDYFPITASCCLPTDEDYDYDASSEEFWGTPNSSTTSPLSVEVNCYNGEQRKNETPFTSTDPPSCMAKTRPNASRLEPLIEEFVESSDNTPNSYEYKEMVFGEGQTLLNFNARTATTAAKDKHTMDKSTTKNLFNVLWRSSRSRTKRTCGSESKFGSSFIRRRRIKYEKSKQDKEIKLNLIESIYLLLFG